jgi:hypothetical protein
MGIAASQPARRYLRSVKLESINAQGAALGGGGPPRMGLTGVWMPAVCGCLPFVGSGTLEAACNMRVAV